MTWQTAAAIRSATRLWALILPCSVSLLLAFAFGQKPLTVLLLWLGEICLRCLEGFLGVHVGVPTHMDSLLRQPLVDQFVLEPRR